MTGLFGLANITDFYSKNRICDGNASRPLDVPLTLYLCTQFTYKNLKGSKHAKAGVSFSCVLHFTRVHIILLV